MHRQFTRHPRTCARKAFWASHVHRKGSPPRVLSVAALSLLHGVRSRAHTTARARTPSAARLARTRHTSTGHRSRRRHDTHAPRAHRCCLKAALHKIRPARARKWRLRIVMYQTANRDGGRAAVIVMAVVPPLPPASKHAVPSEHAEPRAAAPWLDHRAGGKTRRPMSLRRPTRGTVLRCLSHFLLVGDACGRVTVMGPTIWLLTIRTTSARRVADGSAGRNHTAVGMGDNGSDGIKQRKRLAAVRSRDCQSGHHEHLCAHVNPHHAGQLERCRTAHLRDHLLARSVTLIIVGRAKVTGQAGGATR